MFNKLWRINELRKHLWTGHLHVRLRRKKEIYLHRRCAYSQVIARTPGCFFKIRWGASEICLFLLSGFYIRHLEFNSSVVIYYDIGCNSRMTNPTKSHSDFSNLLNLRCANTDDCVSMCLQHREYTKSDSISFLLFYKLLLHHDNNWIKTKYLWIPGKTLIFQ